MDQSTPLPKEVSRFLKERKCPLCQSEIDSDTPAAMMYQLDNIYNALSNCVKDPIHYSIDINWEDPKNITIHSEFVRFQIKDEIFEVTKELYSFQFGNEGYIQNRILYYKDGMEESTREHILGNVFDFENFSQEKTSKKIKMLLTFG